MRYGACATSTDCESGQECSRSLVTTAIGDADQDGVLDASDVCPSRADPAQLDGDGVGDACDLATCGDGVQQYTEQCDHGAQNGSDGLCSAACEKLGAVACADGVDNDGDGRVDHPSDAGCTSASDSSERGTAACDNGVDNDGDGEVDFPSDPGCAAAGSNTESPACQDGLDNDGQTGIDFDGGVSARAGAPVSPAVPDPNCGAPTGTSESPPPPPGCGIGPELAVLLPLVWWARRRRALRVVRTAIGDVERPGSAPA